jgi:hypothetical protein
MILQQYQLDNTILKATDALKLLRSERVIIETDSGTLAVPIKLDNQRKGYIFHGHGKLVLDTIVETEEGAIGKSVEKEVNKPFLMLGDTEEIYQHLSTANKENLIAIGYENEKEFIAKAEEVLHEFSGRRKFWTHNCCSNNHGVIFAFPNEVGKLDILVADGLRLVYKAMDRVFIANENKTVLKTPQKVILSNDRKSLMMRKRHF